MFIFLQNCSNSVYLTKRLLNRGMEGIIGAISLSPVTQGGNTPWAVNLYGYGENPLSNEGFYIMTTTLLKYIVETITLGTVATAQNIDQLH